MPALLQPKLDCPADAGGCANGTLPACPLADEQKTPRKEVCIQPDPLPSVPRCAAVAGEVGGRAQRLQQQCSALSEVRKPACTSGWYAAASRGSCTLAGAPPRMRACLCALPGNPCPVPQLDEGVQPLAGSQA